MAVGRMGIYRDSGVAALAVGLLLGCPTSRTGPPQHYEDPKHMIDVFEDPERDAWQQPDEVVSALPIESKNGVIADIGAGSGYFTRRLAMKVPEGRVFAVDVDSEFEDYLLSNREAWGTPNIETRLAHYDDPMLPKASLDLVFTANTYAFIRDRVAYFTKVRTALKPGGHLAVIEFRPDANAPGNIAPAPQHRVAVETAKKELAEAGFDVASEPAFLEHQWFLVLRARE
jgi:predicted methyltransferase